MTNKETTESIFKDVYAWIKVSVICVGTWHVAGYVTTLLISSYLLVTCNVLGKNCTMSKVTLASDDSVENYQQGYNDAKKWCKTNGC